MIDAEKLPLWPIVGDRRAILPAYLAMFVATAGAILDLPLRLTFAAYMQWDDGGNLAATLLANRGLVPQRDFGFEYGPLTLALQQLSLAVTRHGPQSMALLGVLATLAFGWAMVVAVRDLPIETAAALLLSIAAATTAFCSQSSPVYTLEPAALAWAMVSWARGKPGAALAACVVGALIKPSMSIILGAWLLAGALLVAWRGRSSWRRTLRAPLIALVVLSAGLCALYGVRGFVGMALPLAGMRTYHALHYSFFSVQGNPLIFHLAQLPIFVFTLESTWLVTLAALCVAVPLLARRCLPLGSPAWLRWYASAGCLAGAIAFLTTFYAWRGSYFYYIALQLIGLGLAPWERLDRRGWRRGLLVLAGLSALGTAAAAHSRLHEWLSARPSAASAGLWASAAERQAWQTFERNNPPASRPLFVDGNGSPEAVFPAYGPVWHGSYSPGVATAANRAEFQRRLDAATCVVLGDAEVATLNLTVGQIEMIERRIPHRPGLLFDTYGCQPTSNPESESPMAAAPRARP